VPVVGVVAIGVVVGVAIVDAPNVVIAFGGKAVAGISSVGVGAGGKPVTVRTEELTGPCCTHTGWSTEIWH
jgi:hypothetical protein